MLRLRVLVVALVCFGVSAAGSVIGSCNVHEVGHAVVGSSLGWQVEQIHLCLPTGGSVDYSATPGSAWINRAESFAGGAIAAAALAAVYLFAFVRSRVPLRNPYWWAAGFGPLLALGPQIAVSVAEGSFVDRDYGDVLDSYWPLVIGAMVIGGAAHVWLWRAVLRVKPETASSDSQS